jgi:small multidrug resistance family-3 protein
MALIKSIFLFITAGLLEIGGGYLVWIWIKNRKPMGYGIIGVLLLIAFAFVPVLQTTNFGRVNATYGGIFIVLSILWGWKIDAIVPDKFDIIGGLLCLAGVIVIIVPKR